MNKPKKPLRGLFASTEAPVSTPSRPKTPIPMPSKDQPSRPMPPKPKLPPERLTPKPMPKQVPPMMIMEEAPVTVIEEAPATIMEEAPVMIVEEAPVMIVEEAPVMIEEEAPVMIVEEAPSEGIMQVQYNFESMRPARDTWQEQDYATFLRRLDAIQTEAFILKGKLLAEAKTRFYETNKLGWAEFCDTTLDMNYTTANQYIRVATEFDVTSHQRTDFGFEHFKALLPLPAEARVEFLNSPSPLSVKTIRSRVKEIISAQLVGEGAGNSVSASRRSGRLLKMLELLKQEVISHGESFESLNQNQRWQLAAACQNIAGHLNHLAQTLNSDPTMILPLRSSSARAGAFATADGAATMQEMISIPEPAGSSH